ncbi:hypothetical protein E2C01_050567 [Portunus trituberculatus]|uniref:Uncharacterized protein n=1 Tax=Portunus trituberculatus TaxID=210409 RepID=A0A5B7GGV3_PORTR|nr:hypothetical protein [Portunus trituberculatus]
MHSVTVLPFTYDVEGWFLHLEAVWAGTDLFNLHVLTNPPEADRHAALKSAIMGLMGGLARPALLHWTQLSTTAAAPQRSW